MYRYYNPYMSFKGTSENCITSEIFDYRSHKSRGLTLSLVSLNTKLHLIGETQLAVDVFLLRDERKGTSISC